MTTATPAPGQPIDVCHVITGLQRGGAEGVLARLIRATAPRGIRHAVISLTPVGPLQADIEATGTSVVSLAVDGFVDVPAAIRGLTSILRGERPRIVQTWMYHADLIGGLAARRADVGQVIWGIRQGDLEKATTSRSTRAVARSCAWLSTRVPDTIVACSDSSRRTHVAFGYDPGRMRVIPNGFEVQQISGSQRRASRLALGIPDDVVLVGAAGRFHPQKDHRTYLEAARLVCDVRSDVRFVLCGRGTDSAVTQRWVDRLGLREHTVLLGERSDMAAVYAALDVVCSTSIAGEGFPNVVGEAMSRALPVVATDVGDTATLLGHGGEVVPAGSPLAVSGAILHLVGAGREGRQSLGAAGQRRIVDHFGLSRMVDRYLTLWSGA